MAMSILYTTVKYTGLLANFVYMLLGIGSITLAGVGLYMAEPNTAEHTYFIESIVLGGMICMIVIFGCYGLLTDLLSVNIVFSAFILLLLAVQSIQMGAYHPHTYYKSAVPQPDHAWLQLQSQPHLMLHINANPQADDDDLTKQYTDDYLTSTMYGDYQLATKREQLLNYVTLGLELFILTETLVASVLLYKAMRRRPNNPRDLLAARLPIGNHVDSRSQLLLNVA